MGVDLSKISNPALRAQIEIAIKSEPIRDKQVMYTPKDAQASIAKRENNTRPERLSRTKSEPADRPTLVSRKQGTEACGRRIVVKFVSYRIRPLDPDNSISSHKFAIDACRYAGLIPNDRPEDIKLESEQVKVRHKSEEKTVIEIEYPE